MGIPAGSVMEATWTGTAFGQTIRHTRHWSLASGGTGGGNQYDYALAFWDAIRIGSGADWTTAYLNCMSSVYTMNSLRTQIIFPTRGAYVLANVAGGTVGARGTTNTGNLQACVSAATALGGRSQVSNSKIGPIASGDIVAGLIQAGLTTALNSYAGTFTLAVVMTGTQSSSWVPCVYHRRKAPLVSSADTIFRVQVGKEARVKSTRTIGYGE